MYRRKGKQNEFQLAVKKFLEHHRDPSRRLRALRQAEEKAAGAVEVKDLYQRYSATIFFVFYSSFSSLESAILDKANRGKGYSEVHLKDLRDTIVPALERILIYLPELVHRRWQYNSICLIIRKLLHPENVLKLRKDGIRLLVLWLHALQDNAGDASMELFASAVPHFPPQKTPMGLPTPSSSSTSLGHRPSLSLVERYGMYMYSSTGLRSTDSSTPLLPGRKSSVSSVPGVPGGREMVKVSVLQPLHKAAFAGAADSSDGLVTTQLIQHLMECLTKQVGRQHWGETIQYLRGFAFLFYLFKLFYLACLFKNFRTEAGLYTQPPPPDLNIPQPHDPSSVRHTLQAVLEEESPLDPNTRSLSPAPPSSSPSLQKKHTRERGGKRVLSPYRMSQVIKLDYDLSHPIYDEVKRIILQQILSWLQPEKAPPTNLKSPLPSPSPTVTSPHPSPSSFLLSGEDLIREMWFTSRDNVNLLCEICRQSFLMRPSEAALIKRVIELYWGWVGSGEQPLFMNQPPVIYQEGEGGAENRLSVPLDEARAFSPSSILPWEVLIHYEGHDMRDVRVGLQPSLCMVVSHTSQVFLLEERRDMLSSHLELCRRILRFYQDMVMMWTLDHDSWEYFLATLLHLSLELLRGGPPENRDSTLRGSLATPLLRTLLVCFLRASMVTKVSGRLWDNLSAVLSSLTQWREVVEQWKFVMDTMTQILAQTIYNLDLHDLPLHRLQRDEGRRGVPRVHANMTSDLTTSRLSSFSNIEANMRRPTNSLPLRSKLVSMSRSADGKTKGKMQKALTVDQAPSPSDEKIAMLRTKRIISIPCENPSSSAAAGFASHKGTDGAGSGAKGRCVSNIEKPHSDLLDIRPRRSSSSHAHYQLIKEVEGEEEEGEEKWGKLSLPPPPSPAGSLPADVLLDTEREKQSGSEGDGGWERGREGGEGEVLDESVLIANVNTRTPSPEPEVLSQHSLKLQEGRGGSVEPLLDSQEMDRKEKAKNWREGREGSSWFGRRKLGLSDAMEGKARKKAAVKTSAAQDLVFMNESSQDSVLETEGAAPVRSSSPSFTSSWSAEVSSREGERGGARNEGGGGEGGGGERDGEEVVVKSKLVYKSSSEGNLHKLKMVDDQELSSQSVMGMMSPLMMRRVASSDGQSDASRPQRRSIEVASEDLFSSTIIPSSQARLLSSPVRPRSQSPVHLAVTPASSPQPRPSSRLAFYQTTGTERSDDNSAGDSVSGAGEGGNEEGEVNNNLRKPLSFEQPRSPSPTIAISSPSSPPPSGQIGWSPVVTAVVWQRMLRILGDVNAITDASIHHLAFLTLLSVWRDLGEIDANLGISTDNQTTPPLPEYLPPLLVFAPWVLRASTLPQRYLQGRLTAVQMLCEMNIRHSLSPPSQDLLTHYYRLMHKALQPPSDTLNTAVKYGCKMFSHGLPGCSVLLSDSISACATILSVKTKGPDIPRNESLCLLGSMLFLPELSPSSPPLPAVSGEDGEVVCGPQLKERLVDIIFTAARKEPTKTSRCMALHLVGMMAFSELHSKQPSRRLPEGIDILLASLMFSDRTVSMTAIDMLTLLTEVAPQILSIYPTMPSRVVEGLCYAIAVFMTDPDLEQSSWVNKVIVTLLLCLRDWIMVLPLQQLVREAHFPQRVLKEVFEVLQAAAGSPKQVTAKRHAIAQLSTIKTSVTVTLDPLDSPGGNGMSPCGTARGSKVFKRGDEGSEIQISADILRPSLNSDEDDKVQVAARSTLTHLLNLVGHFPFGCGPAQMTSVVCEHHDSPSLIHLDELSTEIFDSPRVQFFSFNDTAVVILVEIPIRPAGLPSMVTPADYHSRVIVRDVTGKYTWDCAMLYGPQMPSLHLEGLPSITTGDSDDSISLGESASLDGGGMHMAAPPEPVPYSEDPLQPPSCKTHANTDRDILEDLLKHVEVTSPECLLHPGKVGLAEPAPAAGESVRCLEEEMVDMVQKQNLSEQEYTQGAFTLPSMCGEKSAAPPHISAEFAYHHCRVLLSHLGMFSSSRRDHLDLLEKSNQLILELKHLDSTPAQSRMTYKVAVLYVAQGQEDKQSILCNRKGSKSFEEFVSGLGWEVNMETHAGYMGGLKREFCANTTLPYYATSSEEVLFHVSTRMPSKGRDVEQKVRHMGNDEVHIVWSEHWRDYRRTIFKTQFADILIVVYPLSNGLFRIQIIKKPKQNIPLFGPLFDGALVNRESLPSLVRATAINALRAQRSPLVGYRGRYEERLRYIQNIVHRKMKSSYEEFTQNVMHPLESSSYPGTARVSTRNQTPHLEPLPVPLIRRSRRGASLSRPSKTPEETDSNTSQKGGHSPRVGRLRGQNTLDTWSPPQRRPRANTNDDRQPHSKSASELPRNQSVPDKLHQLHRMEEEGLGSSQRRHMGTSTSGGNLVARRQFQRTNSPSPIAARLSGLIPNRSGTS